MQHRYEPDVHLKKGRTELKAALPSKVCRQAVASGRFAGQQRCIAAAAAAPVGVPSAWLEVAVCRVVAGLTCSAAAALWLISYSL